MELGEIDRGEGRHGQVLLGLVCALGLVIDSPVVAVGFLAWGGVLPLAEGLIAVVSRPVAHHPAVGF